MTRAVQSFALGAALAAVACFGSSSALAQGPDSAIVRGTVYDSVHHAPVADATVIAAAAAATDRQGTVRTINTDAHGHFESSLRAARYTLTVDDPRLDSARIEIAPYTVNAAPGGSYDVTLATPSVATRVRLACGRPQRDTTQGAIIGIVTDANSRRPIAGATIALQWSDFSVDRAGKASTMTITRGATTDVTGHFRACGVPIMRTVALQAQVRSVNSGIIEEQIDEGGVLIRELRVPLPASGAAPAPALVEGTIHSVTGAPVREGNVLLVGTARTAHISTDGRFAMDSVPAGTQQIQVVAIGYYPERLRLDLVPGATRAVSLSLETVGAVMDTLIITAHANDPRYREFDRRRMHPGFARILTAADIAKRPIFSTSDLFATMPEVTLTYDQFGHRQLRTFGYHPDVSIPKNFRLPASPAGPTQGGPQCPLLIVDGGQVSSLDDIDAIPPSQIYGIEVYGVDQPIPAQYRGYQQGAPGLPPPDCGAVIVWTW